MNVVLFYWLFMPIYDLYTWQRQFSSVQPFDRLGRRGDTKDHSAEILFQSFLQEALVSSSGKDRDVHSLIFSIQHSLCRPRRRPPPEGWFWRGLTGLKLQIQTPVCGFVSKAMRNSNYHYCYYQYYFTTLLSHWHISLRNFGSFFLGKASCDRVMLPNLWSIRDNKEST